MISLGRTGVAGLVVGLLLCIVVLAVPVNAQTASGDVTVDAIVPGPPPANGPSIDEPVSNATSAEKSVTVGGTCEAGLTVKVFSNDIFVGSALCLATGTYNLPVDLFLNENVLIARQYDSINQPSPDSAAVTVFYLPPTDQPSLTNEAEASVASFQLNIAYDYTSHNVFMNHPFKIPINFVGGASPYTVTVDWGDGSSNNFVRQDNTPFTAEYTYPKSGLYVAVISVKDANGEQAYLQFVISVRGDEAASKPFIEQVVAQITQLNPTNPAFITFSVAVFGTGIGFGFAGLAIWKWLIRLVQLLLNK